MNETGGFNTALSPDGVHTSIDAALYEQTTRLMQPGYIRATDGFFFKQGSTVGDAFIYDEDAGIPNFQRTGDQETILSVDTFLANRVTRLSQKYTSQVPVSDEAFRADMHEKRAAIGREQGIAAARTQDSEALLNTYGDVTAGSIFTTPDGQATASNSHVTVRGQTVDNLETGSLTPDNLWTLTVSLAGQRGQHGDLASHLFEGFVSAFLLYKTAKEVLDSALIANSAENNVNVFDTSYGEVRIGASAFLGSAYNSASNANTTYTIVSRDHAIMRKVFYDVKTNLIPPESTSNDTWLYRVKFNEVAFPGTWQGLAASNGTA